MKPGITLSVCHGAPVSRESYTDILGRERTRMNCDACLLPCRTKLVAPWPSDLFKDPVVNRPEERTNYKETTS